MSEKEIEIIDLVSNFVGFSILERYERMAYLLAVDFLKPTHKFEEIQAILPLLNKKEYFSICHLLLKDSKDRFWIIHYLNAFNEFFLKNNNGKKLFSIFTRVLLFYDLDAELVKGKNRKEHLVKARKLFCILAYEYSNESFERIGNYINRDHSSVMHYMKEAKNEYTMLPEIERFKKQFYYITDEKENISNNS